VALWQTTVRPTVTIGITTDHTTSPIFDRAWSAIQSAISEAIAPRTSSTLIRVINMAGSLSLSGPHQNRREMPTAVLNRRAAGRWPPSLRRAPSSGLSFRSHAGLSEFHGLPCRSKDRSRERGASATTYIRAPAPTSRRSNRVLLSNQAWKSLSSRDRRWVPFAGKRIRLRSVEAHGQIECPFRRGKPVGLLFLARVLVLEIKVE
jgi:hypothetical protein